MSTNSKGAIHSGHVVPVSQEQIRGFISSCLGTLGYENINTPRKIPKITAVRRETFTGMTHFQFEYALRISYRKNDAGSTVLDYEMSEIKQRQSAASCRQALDDVVKTIERDAIDYAEINENSEPSVVHGAARFATEEELDQAGYLTSEISPERLVLAPYPGGRFITIPKAQTCWHALICGPTGAGKSSGFFIPNIVKRVNSSCIITEATAGDEIPELYANTAGWRHFKRNKIYFFNPGFAKGTRINPLDKLRLAPPGEFAAVADEIAQLVIMNTTPPTAQRADPIWDKAEKHLLWILIMHSVASGDPELAHFGAIRQLLRKPEKGIQTALSLGKSQIAKEEFETFVAHSSSNFRHGVFAGLLQRLNPWLTDRVVAMTKTTDLDLNKLRGELFSFYLSVPSRKGHLKPIAALVFNFLLDLALESRFEHPLALILDEFTNFGAIPGIDEALSIIRKREIPVVLGVQTFKQIEKIYGRDIAGTIISQLATRVFFRQRHPETAREISNELGIKTVVQEETDDRGRTTVREFGKPLLTAADLSTLSAEEVVIMTPSTNPLRINRFTFESFPAPSAFDPPQLQDHHVVQSSNALSQEVAEEKAEQAKKAAVITEEERDFIDHKDTEHEELEEQRKKKRPRPTVDLSNFDIPG